MVDCCKCENEATWESINEIVSLDTPYLCDEHIVEVSVTERPEDNPCFRRIVEINEMEKVIA